VFTNREDYYANQPGIEEKFSTIWCKLNDVKNNAHWRSRFGWGTAWHLRRRDSIKDMIKKKYLQTKTLSKAGTVGLQLTCNTNTTGETPETFTRSPFFVG